MPRVSPCGLVVDYVRSCFEGFWRFYPATPNVLTPGFLYFADDDTPALPGPHSFGSGFWRKDNRVYPPVPTGHDPSLGTQYYDGKQPLPLPPDQQIFPTQDFATDLPPGAVASTFKNGFDGLCYVIQGTGVEIDTDALLRPDVTSCCWQRAMAAMLYRLTEPFPTALADFHGAVQALWGPGAPVTIVPADTTVNRWAWIELDTFQIVFRVGTQSWSEIFPQVWHGFAGAHDYGALSTEPVWWNEATALSDALNALGWNPDKPVTFIGHSKGGAVLWVLARRMLVNNAQRNIHVLTFGVPKVGDTRCVQSAGIRESRHVIHRQDVVPLCPPDPPLFPLLEDLLPANDFINFSTWHHFSVYQICGDGWGRALQPADNLDWQTYSAWITLLLQGRVPGPIQQHYLSSYVAALADCCDAPTFPFTEEYWEILFGSADNRDGGGMWGGAGGAPKNAGPITGLALGGAGTPLSDDWILQEDGYPILDEGGNPILRET